MCRQAEEECILLHNLVNLIRQCRRYRYPAFVQEEIEVLSFQVRKSIFNAWFAHLQWLLCVIRTSSYHAHDPYRQLAREKAQVALAVVILHKLIKPIDEDDFLPL